MHWEIDNDIFEENPEKYQKKAKKDIIVYQYGYIDSLDGKGEFTDDDELEVWLKPNKLGKRIKLELDEDEDISYVYGGYNSYSKECLITIENEKMFDYLLPNIKFYCKDYSESDNIDELPSVYSDYDEDDDTKDFFDITEYNLHTGTFIIGKFIIPQGTKYFEDPNGFIMSENIMWTGERVKVEDIEKGKLIKLKNIKLCCGE